MSVYSFVPMLTQCMRNMVGGRICCSMGSGINPLLSVNKRETCNTASFFFFFPAQQVAKIPATGELDFITLSQEFFSYSSVPFLHVLDLQ